MNRELRVVSIGNSRHVIVGNVCQGSHPQLNRTEDTGKAPHVLTLQIGSVAPAINLYSQAVGALADVGRDVEFSRRHGVLAITHTFAIHPNIKGRLDTSKMKYQVLTSHLRGDIEGRDILSNRVTQFVGRPIRGRFLGDAGSVLHEGVLHVHIDGFTVILHLPVARYTNLVPLADIEIFAIEIYHSCIRIGVPTEMPLAIKVHDFLTFFLFRRQLQRGMIGQFVDAQNSRILPIWNSLCLYSQSQHSHSKHGDVFFPIHTDIGNLCAKIKLFKLKTYFHLHFLVFCF